MASFSLLLAMVAQGPVFTDETSWLLQTDHMLFDGWRMVNMYPTCESNFSWAIPWPMLPGRLFAGLLHPDTLVMMREQTAGKYLGCIGLLAAIMRQVFEGRMGRLMALGVSASVLSVGFLPVLYLFNRPEINIMLGFSALVLMALMAPKHRGRWQAAVFWAGYFFLLSWVFSQHPKVQALLPAVGVMAWVMARQAFAARGRVVFLLMVGVMMLACVALWRVHQTCPDSPQVVAFLEHHTITPQQLWREPLHSLKLMVQNVSEAKNRYLKAIAPGTPFLLLYGVENQLAPDSLLLGASALGVRALLVLLGAVMMAAVLRVMEGRAGRKDAVLPLSLPLLILLAPLQVVATKNNIWSFWEAGYVFYLFLLSFVLLISGLRWHVLFPRIMAGMMVITVGVAVVSQVQFRASWAGFYARVESPQLRNGYTGGFTEKDLFANHFQGIFDGEQRRRRIETVAAQCHIPLDGSGQHIVFDDWTYMDTYRNFEPFYGNFLMVNPPEHESIMAFLKRKQSSGVIMLCSSLPPELKEQAVELEGVCCLKP